MDNILKDYRPDIINCISNLSNDEVFTPPDLANDVLDLLPKEIWSNSSIKFLDPACKTGVFLREISNRLIEGLKEEIPDLQTRINHILTHQVYGVAITELTSHMARRTLYCSKTANGKYSICTDFKDEQGNIRFNNVGHRWEKNKCVACGASNKAYNRSAKHETYAYEFIHKETKEVFGDMKFDVIIGNPPYQLNDGGGTGSSAVAIYHLFVEQAKKLNPRYITMIIPSRWFTGGRGLDSFRQSMLSDKHIRELHDYVDAFECFPGVEIKGGVCYFLRDSMNEGKCKVVSHYPKREISVTERYMLEDGLDVFIRDNEALSIIAKVQASKQGSFSDLISANDPFGFDVRAKNSYRRVKPNFKLSPFEGAVQFYYNGWRKTGVGYIASTSIQKNQAWISKPKLLFSKAWGNGNRAKDILNPMFVSEPSVCTETYLVVGPFDDEKTCRNVEAYINTKFFHFMVSLVKNTQNTMKKAYTFVPLVDFSRVWTDEELYVKFGLSEEEIGFIESTTRTFAATESDGESEEDSDAE